MRFPLIGFFSKIIYRSFRKFYKLDRLYNFIARCFSSFLFFSFFSFFRFHCNANDLKIVFKFYWFKSENREQRKRYRGIVAFGIPSILFLFFFLFFFSILVAYYYYFYFAATEWRPRDINYTHLQAVFSLNRAYTEDDAPLRRCYAIRTKVIQVCFPKTVSTPRLLF